MGSFLAIVAITVRDPPESNASLLAKASDGNDSAGHETSTSASGVKIVPNRNGAAARTTVLTGGPAIFFGGSTSAGPDSKPLVSRAAADAHATAATSTKMLLARIAATFATMGLRHRKA